MKKIVVAVIMLTAGLSFTQPLTLEQAPNVLKAYQLEIGTDPFYAYDNWTITGAPDIQYTRKDLTLALAFRYATDDQTELALNVPCKYY